MITGTTIPTAEPCVGTKLDHPERNNRTRKRVTVSAGTDEGIDVVSEVARLRKGNRINPPITQMTQINRRNLWMAFSGRGSNGIDKFFQCLQISQIKYLNRRMTIPSRP